MAQLKDLLVMGPGRVIGDAFFGGKLMPTITDTQDIGSSTIKWNNIYGTLKGNADTASYPEGFDNRVSNDTWGNDIGTAVTEWQMTNGGKIGFKNNNPQTGLLSLFINGRLYTSGSYPVPGLESSNSIWGLTDPDGATSNVAIRTPANGLYPYAPSNSTTAYSSLGAENWYFNTAYIKTIYGYLSGTAAEAEAPSATITNYGVAYYDNNGKFASTLQGSGDQALVGSSTGPSWADIATTLTITGAANTDTDKFQISVLGQNSGDAIGLTKATTSLYGVVKLSSSLSSSDTISAATPKAVLDAIAANATLNVSSTQYGLAYFTNTTGTIGSTGAGSGSQALTGNTTGGPPGWTDIDTTVTIVAGTSSATPKVKVKVLGIEATSGGITTASTSKYGATKLSSSAGSTTDNVFTRNTSSALAATPSMVWAAIDTLDYTGASTNGSALEFITGITQTDGKISATKAAVQSANGDTAGVVDANEQTFKGHKTFSDNITITGLATFNGNVLLNSATTADNLTAGSLLVTGNTSLVNTATTTTILPAANNSYNIGASGNKYATIYATTFDGAAEYAKKAYLAGASTGAQYGVLYLTASDKTIGATGQGNANTLLRAQGSDGAPYFDSISSALSIDTANKDNGQTISVAFMGINGTSNVTLAKATATETVSGTTTDGVYGVTKLSHSIDNTKTVAATPYGVKTYVDGEINDLTADMPSSNGTATNQIVFVSSVTESSGVISVQTQTVRSATTSQSGVVTTGTQSFAGSKTFTNAITVTGEANFNGNVHLNSSTIADSFQAGSLVVSGASSLTGTITTSNIIPANNNAYNIGTESNKYATIYATTFSGNASTATKLSNTPASNGTKVFLRGDNTWTNKLENTFESSGTPGFYANVAAGSWAYLRLQSGSTLFWDVAMKSNDNDGALEFRPAGTANKGPYIHYTGNMRIANAGTTDASNTTSALTLRETGYAGAGTDNWTTAPRLAFNWSGRKYAQIGLASNGYLYTAPNSQQANWYKIMYESGTWTININGDSTSCSGNAASASTVFASLSTSEKTYLLGTTSSLTSNGDNVELTGDSGVYLTQNTGEISAVRHSWNYSGTEKAYTIWNNSTNSIDIMFL